MQENAGGQTTPLPQILLVVNQQPLLEAFGWALEKAGFSTCVAVNCEEAIKLFHQHKQTLGLVITDLRWPDTEGPRIIARLQEMKPSLRFCFVSDNDVQYLDGRLWELGPSPLLRKPFTLEQFGSAVALILRPD
jgi:two-component system, cell cycle sensor histidine kinase and response regulator CckA